MVVNYPSTENVLKLVQDSDSYEYWMYPCKVVDLNQDKSSTSISLPGEAPRDNILMGLSGMSLQIPVDFTVWNDGEDRANGSYTSTVKTVGEQVDYLLEEIHDPNYDTGWTVEQMNGFIENRLPENASNDNKYSVHIENIRVPAFDTETPKWVRGSIEFVVGSSI